MAFGYYATVTTDNTKVLGSSNFTNFPILISGTYDGTGGEPDLRVAGSGGKVQNASGYDIYFYSDANLTVKLDHQIVSYTGATGVYKAFVEVPTLDYNDDTVIYMAYGDSGISSDPSTSGTWNSNYKHVWSMHESSGTTLTDWIGTADLTKKGSTEPNPQATGAVHRSQLFDDGNDYAKSNTMSGINISTGTLFYWAYAVDNDLSNNIQFSLGPNDSATRSDFFCQFTYNTGYNRLNAGLFNGGTQQWNMQSSASPINTITTNTWYRVALVQNGTYCAVILNGTLYQDGDLTWNSTTDKTKWFSDCIAATPDANEFTVGNYCQNNNYTLAYNDKIELCGVATITDYNWWLTAYNSEGSPASFYTMGNETAVGGGATRRYYAPGIWR